jgi:hypothetical protein
MCNSYSEFSVLKSMCLKFTASFSFFKYENCSKLGGVHC